MHIRVDDSNLDHVLDLAADVLCRGGIVAYPTETFYGLGVKFDMPGALERLCALKNRPQEKAMPVIIGDRGSLSRIVAAGWLEQIPERIRSLMDRSWPGPLTFLLPAAEGLPELLTAGTGKIAVRIPGLSFALHLARRAGFPFTATSANPSGMPPASDADTVERYFGCAIDLIVDAGPAPGGIPSTILDATGPGLRIVREGAAVIPDLS